MSTDDTTTTDDSTSNCGASTTDTDDSASSCGGSTTDTDDSASSCGGASGSSDSSGCGASSDTDSNEQTVSATVDDFDADPGSLVAVGLGPGRPEGMTDRATAALADAEHIVGYTTYVDLLPDEITDDAEEIYDTPMCGEVSRTEEAVDRALAGNHVAIIGSGDPNVYALAGLALEITESKGATPSMLDFEVVPGVPAAQSCGARLGAPLVNDSVSISLSDHLTPMPEIESRLHAVASEEFTISIYNPWSRKRRENFQKACEILLAHRDADTPVGIVHGAGREDEEVEITTLGELESYGETDLIDMTTTVVIGNAETYVFDDRMVTPRGYETKYDY
ncbi:MULTISPECIES: precorrin-3B C(17)-methyltransferase [Halobacterium]|uniref:precorrin-3B C(17)-methyltransferase n=1 Tax=Halobacterium TaxID=2239 RepID=UPI0019631C66|nr:MULTISPECIES: precorrin-3B C(17)-methyltransferase [Halobacterium]MCF2165997.1 precorrin-3B C(17)-methyltransferase [Halobacterium salinarum]MCF2167517.1 precorrin-3B C(17)-methyltransferase [Halobacterium salinarum]MCF2239366.1 precorrin-3B C(17)-methyltransferase [Halobacterium salinarum]MDL0128429.1 precorrin-3B C(17)-methyltransferase [Halobacterium salinarum]QRY21904.1 precorrin-3B C(17)-methyltransferase [Halobacterium sp. GSL-19]